MPIVPRQHKNKGEKTLKWSAHLAWWIGLSYWWNMCVFNHRKLTGSTWHLYLKSRERVRCKLGLGLLRVPWTARRPVHPKGNQSWIFIGRTDVEAETPILGPPDAKSWPIWKDPDAGKDWGQEEKEMTEDEMVGWHHWLNGHGFGWTPGVGDGQGGLVCCGSWGCKESDMTEQLNWAELNWRCKLVAWTVKEF